MRASALRAATAASIAALLLLSGCSLLPSIPDFGGGDSSRDNGSDSSDDVENNPFLDHGVPDGFPSEVPLPDLEIYFSLTSTEDSWSIIYKADDLESDFADVVAMFESDGWEIAMNNSSSDGALGAFQKDPYTVQVTGVADGSSDFDGPGLSMTVVRTN
jgi:hypothetical protein